MSYSPKELVRILRESGFEFKRSKGSHHIYENEQTRKTVVVPIHSNRDLPKGTYHAILKQAGIDKDQIK